MILKIYIYLKLNSLKKGAKQRLKPAKKVGHQPSQTPLLVGSCEMPLHKNFKRSTAFYCMERAFVELISEFELCMH